MIQNNRETISADKPKALVVLLHGYGGNGDDIFRALGSLQQRFPSLAFVTPNGHFHLQNSSYAWVKLSMPFSWQQLEKGVPSVASIVHQYIQAELDRLGLTYEQLVLVGFSQGALVSLELGLTSPISPKAVIMLSGFFAVEESLKNSKVKPPVYLLAGENDEIMNKEQAQSTAVAMSEAGVKVQTFEFSGLGHRIDKRVVDKVSEILIDRLDLE